MMLMHESYACQVPFEMKFEVCNPHSFSNTLNAQISAQLQISTLFELAPLLRLKIWSKRSPSNKHPLRKNEVWYSVRCMRCIQYF